MIKQHYDKIVSIMRRESPIAREDIELLIESDNIGMISNCYELSPEVKLRMSLRSIAKRRQYYICESLFAKLANLNYAVIKGEVLSSRIYENPIARMSCDIDILISIKDAQVVKKYFSRKDSYKVNFQTVRLFLIQEKS